MTITGYTTAVNDRFGSGFPTAPVESTSPTFAGAGYDWSGVGWSTTAYASSSYKGFAMLSPVHFLTAQHYEYSSPNNELTQGVRVLDKTGTVHTQSNSGTVSNLGQGLQLTNQGYTNYDLAIGTLAGKVAPAGLVARNGVLDLHNTSASDTLSNYTGLNLLLYGRSSASSTGSPRVGATTLSGVFQNGTDTKQLYIQTTRTDVQMQVGDSGYPALYGWTNANGGKELTVLGLNSAIDATYNYLSFLASTAAMSAANAAMNASGYALRVVGNYSNTWAGSSSTSINNRSAWGLSAPSTAPSDKYVLFDGATAGNSRQVTVNANHDLRGLYFKSTASASDGFSFNGTSTLTIGRGGVVNYDADTQVFNAPLLLGDSQYWDVGAGGVLVSNLNTNAKLLEFAGSGSSRIRGVVSGNGSLALSQGTLELSGANTYAGTTWVHGGTLKVNNTSGSATGSGAVLVEIGASLAGAGTIGGNVTVSGSVAPGNSIGTLTIQGDLRWNSNDAWKFELGSPAASFASASMGGSTQDSITISGAGSDFLKGTGSVWTFDVSNTGATGWYRLITWGGTTDFASGDFAASSLPGGLTASFLVDGGTQSLYMNVIPEPAAGALLGVAAVVMALRRRQSKRP